MAPSLATRASKPKLALMLLSAVLLAPPLAAQDQARLAVVKLMPFSGEGFIASELNGLQSLVAAQIVELRSFRLTDDSGRDLALSETEQALAFGSRPLASVPLSADYVLSGSLSRVGDLVVFSLANTRVRDGEKLVVSDSAPSINEIAARSRALTRSLFSEAQGDALALSAGGGLAAESASAGAGSGSSEGALKIGESPAAERAHGRPSMAMLAATWRGDKGLETIRLYPNGTGLAFLSGGGTMRLRLRVQGTSIEIWQDQANDPAMYRSPNWGFDTAQLIAKEARPMRWLFSLSEDGQALFGTKESVAYDGVSRTVDNGYVREARWERLSR